jgi:hypothetical protein
MNLPQKIYTDKEVTRAKNTAQLVGIAQGVGAMIVLGVGLKLLGWIPVLLVLGGVAWVLYKFVLGGRGSDEGAGQS